MTVVADGGNATIECSVCAAHLRAGRVRWLLVPHRWARGDLNPHILSDTGT